MTVPEGFHHHGEKITYRDHDDDYLYHVTPHPDKVIKEGLHPNKKASMGKGFYRDYSKGKAFLTERSKALWWKDRIDEHLEHQHDDPPETHIVRIHKSKAKNLKADEVGNKDAGGGSHYTTEPVGHSQSQHSEGNMDHAEVLHKHGYKKVGSSNVFQNAGGHSVTVGEKGNWAHGKVIGGKNTMHTEGDSANDLAAHLDKFHWRRKTTHTNRDRKEILPRKEEPESESQHTEVSDVTQFTEQVLPAVAVVPAMQQTLQFSEPFSTFGSRLAASKSTKKEG